ncbi:NADP-dependent phosphogluconate dehydrogenase [Pseudorhodobacter turbinis]|uniref:6-phosphogluconate dehydrogenase, decarboxylating n=1 Tax=Pseudorhodobacter turbinis TaxID=2500533 RepID=A0A4V1E0S3_9RHOB|nr:NADP-dependent phosphogluconate dehydrogenase [Pseudorhodobacter turbinis]QCO55634.1 NADP-dependent phosphogluconate dehydrogenase [Pseudorhodobacter turbinis]
MTQSEIGLIGLGTMGAMLALNIAEKGFAIAVWNRTTEVTQRFVANAGDLAPRITATQSLAELVRSLKAPRAIILMVPAGQPVDDQIAALTPLLDEGDMIIDAGNANFRDTNRRAQDAAKGGPQFLGIGVSGGEEGARHGPSIMGGGRAQDWARIEPVLQAIAAKYEGTPCATLMGEAGAGHFVKTVHNGIEYADMQMIAEVYGVMRDGMSMPAAAISGLFDGWNKGPLQSYLIEISAAVTAVVDQKTNRPIVDVILDRAGQKGTGRWTAIEAQHLSAPIPVIEAAVMARNTSARLEERLKGEARFGAAPQTLPEGALMPQDLEAAMIAGKILCYAQGFALISAASDEFGWALPLPEIAKVWREGCIIRSAMLNDMAQALAEEPGRNLIFAPFFADHLEKSHKALRKLVAQAALCGLPLPALASGLAWFDMMRTGRSTANMIQAQRDFFGAHGFERIDGGADHHGPWALQGG